MKEFIKDTLRRFGYQLVHYAPSILAAIPDLTEEEQKIILAAKPYTMTGVERMASLLQATTYISKNNIPGDIVECGVWRGGSMMVIASTLMALGDKSRDLYLYDTYEGMTAPTDHDKTFWGATADHERNRETGGKGNWCDASLEDVQHNILSTGYPKEKIHFVQGKVEETIPATIPSNIALLRLDTDWYESTKHELEHLYPLLAAKGIMIIDDYGYWQGSRKAVDEYFQSSKEPFYLHRVDYTARLLVKGSAS